jgi:hypothetical protein
MVNNINLQPHPNIPLFTSDELPHYKTILSEIYSEEIPVEKTGKRGGC